MEHAEERRRGGILANEPGLELMKPRRGEPASWRSAAGGRVRRRGLSARRRLHRHPRAAHQLHASCEARRGRVSLQRRGHRHLARARRAPGGNDDGRRVAGETSGERRRRVGGRHRSEGGRERHRFRPMRRSIAILPAPASIDVRRWPMVVSEPHSIYFRPESGGLLFCPMDEAAMAPCDATPDEVIIAAGLERLRALAPALVPRTLGRRWGGLRTFAPDRVPVVGDDPALEGFFWLAGQGGAASRPVLLSARSPPTSSSAASRTGSTSPRYRRPASTRPEGAKTFCVRATAAVGDGLLRSSRSVQRFGALKAAGAAPG